MLAAGRVHQGCCGVVGAGGWGPAALPRRARRRPPCGRPAGGRRGRGWCPLERTILACRRADPRGVRTASLPWRVISLEGRAAVFFASAKAMMQERMEGGVRRQERELLRLVFFCAHVCAGGRAACAAWLTSRLFFCLQFSCFPCREGAGVVFRKWRERVWDGEGNEVAAPIRF